MTNMTDSETDILPNNVISFRNTTTAISAKGPNNSTNMSFRNNIHSSAINMPWNMERPRYTESVYDQRSVYSRREMSPPLSLHSGYSFQPRSSRHSYYKGGIGSQRSIYNERGGSPMSLRTIDSNTSVSAVDIATAFKTMNFNKYDLRIIKDAYNKFLKKSQRRRIEKRRNRRFIKGGRYKSGGESGEQGSDSSVSSDDCRSTRSYLLKDTSSCRSTRTNLSDFRRTMQDSNMYRDCTENFKQNALKNMFSLPPRTVNESYPSRPPLHNSLMTQKERFKQGYLLPSQRFNQSVASQSIAERPHRHRDVDTSSIIDIGINKNHMERNNLNSSSEQDEIFAERTVNKTTDHNTNGKRILDDPDMHVPDKKRTKISPLKQVIDSKTKTPKQSKDDGKPNDFIFARPQFPVKKIPSIKNVVKTNSRVSISIKKTPVKPAQNARKNKSPKTSQITQKLPDDNLTKNHIDKTIPPTKSKKSVEPVTSLSPRPVEKLISKSKQPLHSIPPKPVEQLISKSSQHLDSHPTKVSNPTKEVVNQDTADLTQFSTTDMSMRPSFIKRKLFSQKADLADKNSSTDNLDTTPPANVYSAIQKEKNKTRKLVTSQSCLNHDLGDESNLLDLIHKIVPANRLNITTATNKSDHVNKPANAKKSQNWDISTVIASCSNDDVSDTFTDEEIFQTTENIGEISQDKKTKTKKIEKEPAVQILKEPNKNGKEPAPDQTKRNNKGEQNKEAVVHKKETQKKKTDIISPCNIVVKRLQPIHNQNITKTNSGNNNGLTQSSVLSCVKSFWDTDIESDVDNTTPVKQPEKEAVTLKGATNCTKVQKEQVQIQATTELAIVTNIKQVKPNNNKHVLVQKEDIVNKENIAPNDTKAKQSNVTTANNAKQAKQNSSNTVKKKNKLDTTSTSTLKKSSLNSKDTVKNQASANKAAKQKVHTEKIKINNNTLRIRTCRTPKINRCCMEPSTTEESINDTTIYRSLRSRDVDLSTSLKSDVSIPKKTLVSKVKHNITKKKDTSVSDVSFTLSTDDVSKKVSRTHNNITKTNIRTQRGHNLSLTFTPEKDLNRTMTRSRRNTKTIENSLIISNTRSKRSTCNKTNISMPRTKAAVKSKASKPKQ